MDATPQTIEVDHREHDLALEHLEPGFGRVTIRIARPAEKVGNVFLPENRSEKPNEGIVVRVGAGCKWLKPGDRVVYGRYAGSDIELSPVRGTAPKVIICDEQEVLARIRLTQAEPYISRLTQAEAVPYITGLIRDIGSAEPERLAKILVTALVEHGATFAHVGPP